MKKKYYITMSGESYGCAIRELTQEQYELIEDLFDELNSEYCGGTIDEIPDLKKLFSEFLEYIKDKTVTAVHLDIYEFLKTKKELESISGFTFAYIRQELESMYIEHKQN